MYRMNKTSTKKFSNSNKKAGSGLLKDLSQSYLQDGKSLEYKWSDLLKKATRD